MAALGIDPDTNTPSFAWVQDGKVLDLRVANIKSKERGFKHLAIFAEALDDGLDIPTGSFSTVVMEGQMIYPYSKARPNDIIKLSFAAGLVLGYVMTSCQDWVPVKVLIPEPQRWKGTVPKHIHHARICSKLGWKYKKAGTRYAYPLDSGFDFKQGDWEHLMDAIGLALWGEKNGAI